MNEKLFLLLEFLRHNISRGGRGPSFSELVAHMNVGSKQTIEDWLAILENEGYIVREGNPRKIKITKKGEAPPEILKFEPKSDNVTRKTFTPLKTDYTSAYLNSPLTGGGTTLKITNINLYIAKGGEKDGTK